MIDVVLAQAVPREFYDIFGVQFFSYVLPWLLTFAIVYGILDQIDIPESKPPRAVIGVVMAFIIAPALSSHVAALMRLSSEFVIVLAGFFMLIVLLEVLGVKFKEPIIKETEQGQPIKADEKEISIFAKYPKLSAISLGILTLLVFFGSGAHKTIGVELPRGFTQNYPLLFFLGFMVLVVWWMVSD